MKKLNIVALTLVLTLGLAFSAGAQPSFFASIGENNFNLTFDVTSTGFIIPTQTFTLAGLGELTVSANVDLDPLIFYNLTAKNFAAVPTDFSIVLGPFGTGIPGPINVFASTAGSLQDTSANGTASIIPLVVPLVPGSPDIQTNVTETNVWGVNTGVTSVAGIFDNPFAFSFTNSGLAGPNTLFAEAIGFTLSALDSTAFTGTCQASAVPVPPTLVLFGGGLLGLLGLRRRFSA